MTDVLHVLDESLARFASKGPEFGPGLANHGPMASEALVALGREDAVAEWSSWYAGKLDDLPERRSPIAAGEWREALGDIGRTGDWSAFFERELAAQPWAAVLDAWVARLAPGIMAGATHGIIRTAHAVRALSRGETPQRVRELGEGLAYWAARYQELPTATAAPGRLSVQEAVAATPVIPPGERRRFLITDAVRQVDANEFSPVINLVSLKQSPAETISAITRTFVRLYSANAVHAPIPFVHTVTAPSGLRLLAPYLSDTTIKNVLRYGWQACAAVYSAYARPSEVPDVRADDTVFDRGDLIQQAVTGRDEHGIKFAEACLREYDITADPAFLAGAADAVSRLRAAPG